MTQTIERERAYVVFQGGGALGVAHFGAWQAIAREFDIIGVAGTSSGSIVAALCAAGVDPEEATKSFKEELPNIIGRKCFVWSLIDTACRALFGRDASNDGKHFQDWLKQQLESGLGNGEGDITFEGLYQRKGIYLEVVACNLRDGDDSLVTFSPHENKRVPVFRAVRASISLPGLFKVIRIGNREFGDGGLKLNFPIKNLYERAKKDDCALIGVRFKKSPPSFNSSNIRHVFSRSYELVMSNSSPVSDDIKNYPKCKIVEITDCGFNPLNFKLSNNQLTKLQETGKEATEEQLEELQRKLREVKSKLRSRLSPRERENIDEAQHWLISQSIPRAEEICKDVLRRKNLDALELDERKAKYFCWEIRTYLIRVSESLFYDDYDFLEDRLVQPSLSPLTVYSEVLNCIKENIPPHLIKKDEIRKRIDYLKQVIIQAFGNN